MRTSSLKTILGLATVSLLAAAPLQGQQPYEMEDQSWIRIDGTVQDVRADAFTLNYGNGFITVEMDDGDRDADAYKLVEGDKVTVSGMIDDDLFQAATIEASSVYVENLDTYFYSSSLDEEDTFVTITEPITVANTIVQGTVTEVNPSESQFKIYAGSDHLTVDVREMAYNPLDDVGYQRLSVGDYVSVSGDIDYNLIEGRHLSAESVTTLVRD